MIAVIAGILMAFPAGQELDGPASKGLPKAAAKTEQAKDSIVGPVLEGMELIGKTAPALSGVRWLDGKRHPLSDDRGKVVLIRWWTDGCPYCVNTAPALRALKKKFGDDLVIRALYHEKPAGRHVTSSRIQTALDDLDLPFLIGHDREWTALNSWWFAAGARRYTSVTFLLDPAGKISLIHTGTEYHTPQLVPANQSAVDPKKAEADYKKIEARIAKLLETRTTSGADNAGSK